MADQDSTTTSASSAEEARLKDTQDRRDRQVAAVGAMNTFKMSDVLVFDTTPEDLRWSALDQAHALCIALSIGLDETTDASSDSTPIRPIHLARSIDAVATLIAISAFAAQAVA